MQLSSIFKKLTSGEGRTLAVKKNIIYSILIKVLSIVVSFMLVPMTIGYVSSELYGVWLTLSSILTWLTFLDLGFSQGMKNKLTEAIANDDWERGKKLVSTTYFLMILIFVPVCIIIQFLIPVVDWCKLLNISTIYQDDIIKTLHVLMAFCCLQMIVNVVVSVIAAFQRVALSNSFGVIGNVISLGIIFVLTKLCPPSLIYLCFSLAAMPIVVTIIASIVLFSGSMKRVAPSFKSIEMPLTKDLFTLGYKFFIINIQAVVLYQATNVIISNVSSPIWVTSYNIAYKYLSIAMMLFTVATQPLWPAYTDAFVRGDYEWMKHMRIRMKRMLLLSVLVCFAMLAISPIVYHLWIGDDTAVPFCMSAMVFLYVSVYCWMTLNCTLIVGMGKIKLETVIVTFGMFVHIPLSYFLSKYIGAYGVVSSMILVNLLYAIVFGKQVNKLLNKTATGIWNE